MAKGMLNGNIRCIDLEEVLENKGGIYIPSSQKAFRRLKVVNTGHPEVKVDDEIIVPSVKGTPIKLGDKDYVIINYRDIIEIL